MMNDLNAALTPAFSRRTGEGEEAACHNFDRVNPSPRVKSLSLSHRMGEGRGEGLSKKSANQDAQSERGSVTRSNMAKSVAFTYSIITVSNLVAAGHRPALRCESPNA